MKDAGQVILQTPLEGLANELCEVGKLFYHIDGFSVNPEAVEGESSLLMRHSSQYSTQRSFLFTPFRRSSLRM